MWAVPYLKLFSIKFNNNWLFYSCNWLLFFCFANEECPHSLQSASLPLSRQPHQCLMVARALWHPLNYRQISVLLISRGWPTSLFGSMVCAPFAPSPLLLRYSTPGMGPTRFHPASIPSTLTRIGHLVRIMSFQHAQVRSGSLRTRLMKNNTVATLLQAHPPGWAFDITNPPTGLGFWVSRTYNSMWTVS